MIMTISNPLSAVLKPTAIITYKYVIFGGIVLVTLLGFTINQSGDTLQSNIIDTAGFSSRLIHIDRIADNTLNESLVNVSKIKESLFQRASDLYVDYNESVSNEDLEIPNQQIQLDINSTGPDGRTKHLPDCILIGERKTGTTAMMHFLKQHPKVQTSNREVHFFDKLLNYEKGVGWYRDQMLPALEDEITFEKSPSYFRTPYVPMRVYQMNPDIKLMLQVKDPIKRAISDFHFSMASDWYPGFEKVENKTFEEYVINSETGEVNADFAPLIRSMYYIHLERWLRYFNLDHNFHIIEGGAFEKNPVRELKKIEQFLKVKPYYTQKMFFYSKLKGFYCLKDPGCIAFGGHGHPPVDEEVINKLKEFFKPHNEKFYEMVGRNFGW